jgi:hypothetical protein
MMSRLAFALVLSSTLLACDNPGTTNNPPGTKPGPGTGSAQRTALLHKNHVLYNRFEGISNQNSCTFDTGCFRGGCSQEVCSAEKGVNTTCDTLAVQIPASASCGCIQDQCLWFTTDGTTLPQVKDTDGKTGGTNTGGTNNGGTDPVPPPSTDGPTCGNKTCDSGEKCIEYFGVAGPAGPKFHECGIPCHPQKHSCPQGMTCTIIADGPGPVCRRKA